MILLPVVALSTMSFFARKPDNLGVDNGRLASCPDKPNCVSTQSDDSRHSIEPIRFTDSADAARERLRVVLGNLPRTKIVTDRGNYVHAESRSRLFRFVDDVEFWIDEAAGLIHFRSASRVGHSDFGVNRRRAEDIRKAFQRLAAVEASSIVDS